MPHVTSEISFRDGALKADVEDSALLEAVFAHYHRSLADTPAVHSWLADHGVTSSEAVETFGVGFSDRTLGLSLPTNSNVAGRKLRGRLQDLGVLRSTGHEQFRGCVVVPVRDGEGRIVQAYGRRLNRPQQRGEAERVEVLWLSAPPRAVWNLAALSASAELVAADSVLDGLVWSAAGYRNVLAPGGPDGWPDDLGDRLVDAGVTRVLLAQARTAAGDEVAAALAAQLAAVGVECFRVVFPKDCDASTVAVEAKEPTVALGSGCAPRSGWATAPHRRVSAR